MSTTSDESAHRTAMPFLGVDPESLSLRHRIPRLPALAVRTQELPQLDDASVELRLLGTGHQLVLRLQPQQRELLAPYMGDPLFS